MNTVAGIIMAHRKGETPVSGAEISTLIRALFVGKQIFDGDKFVSVKLRKGGAKDPLHGGCSFRAVRRLPTACR